VIDRGGKERIGNLLYMHVLPRANGEIGRERSSEQRAENLGQLAEKVEKNRGRTKSEFRGQRGKNSAK
jgi:hypothetical protein